MTRSKRSRHARTGLIQHRDVYISEAVQFFGEFATGERRHGQAGIAGDQRRPVATIQSTPARAASSGACCG